MKNNNVGKQMYQWAEDLFPINRSLTGDGVRETLDYLKIILPELAIKSVPTGYTAFDWEVPKEWNITNAYIENENGTRILDFKENNLHVVGYSTPVDEWLDLQELDNHLYSSPDQPQAIPYVTSYYKERWGFCMTHEQRKSLEEGKYHVVIESELKQGVLNYAELIIPGRTTEEIFLSTYICHPSMANNELSGPVVTTCLAKWIAELPNRKYTYRIVFVPETIGSIVYLSKNIKTLKEKVYAGFNITCVGDDRTYSFLPSRNGNTIADYAARHTLKHLAPNFDQYTWLDRGSDERQYCSPGVDLPIASMMRSKYGEYPEYHTSKDNLELISPEGLEGGFNALKTAIEIIENNGVYKATVFCEPQLGKRGLYPTISTKGSANEVRTMTNFISYCDGTRSLLAIAGYLDKPVWELYSMVNQLMDNGLVRVL